MKSALLATCLTATMLAATPGFAQQAPQQPPPGYGEPPPGYAPAPPGYAPQPGYGQPPYGQPAYGQPQFYYPPPALMGPPPRMERRSKGMMIGGIVLLGVGGLSLITGLAVYAAGSVGSYNCSSQWGNGSGFCGWKADTGTETAGVALMIAGVAGLGVGIPLTVIGAKKVPVDPQTGEQPAQSTVPTLRLGAGKATLDFAF